MWADSCANAEGSAWENAAEAAHPDDVGREAIADLIREVVGNPFRAPALTPWCVTPDVSRMARVIYDSRAWTDLPILADALEEAGCADAAVLKHLRTPVKHVRGCWALDLVLGKS
jgi:hypothetical protein